MDSHQQHRYESSGQGRENKPQRKKALGGAGPGPCPLWGNEEAEKKSKFVSMPCFWSKTKLTTPSRELPAPLINV